MLFMSPSKGTKSNARVIGVKVRSRNTFNHHDWFTAAVAQLAAETVRN